MKKMLIIIEDIGEIKKQCIQSSTTQFGALMNSPHTYWENI